MASFFTPSAPGLELSTPAFSSLLSENEEEASGQFLPLWLASDFYFGNTKCRGTPTTSLFNSPECPQVPSLVVSHENRI